jgi:two-component SAPR family response regulator
VIISEKNDPDISSNSNQLHLTISDLRKSGSQNIGHESSKYLLIDSLPDSLWQINHLLDIWEKSGQMPNFLSASGENLTDRAELVKSLNKQPKIFGVVRDGEKLLTDVSWKDFPNRKTNGYFSFPLRSSGNPAFAPYKPGYRFSPDIILPAPENLPNLKIFNALPLDPDFGLSDHFLFSGKVNNLNRKNDSEITLYGLRFINDPELGNCAFFSGKAYLDGGLQSRSALKPNFSITAWIKPTEQGNNNCILAKGKDFVLKIHQGQLTFTVQGIKDYRSVKTMIPVNQWSFVSLVHSEAENHIRFYLNGEPTDEIQLLTAYKTSDYTLLIGSNLWEEFFEGAISEIKIWERELNHDEIQAEFRKELKPEFRLGNGWLLGILLVLLILGFVLRRRLLTEKPEKSSPNNFKISEAAEIKITREQISCFGSLKVINPEGKDISSKFSPKIRQLFILILLHSQGNEKGISSQKLSDCLWPGMSVQNAKNIRGTTIQNLKALLVSTSIKLVFQDKLWKFDLSETCFSELDFVEQQLHLMEASAVPNPSFLQIQELMVILKRGTLFNGLNESWLDPYVERMSNRIIELGLKLFREFQERTYDSLLLDVAEVISINDPLNEPALRKKIGILTRQGKLSLAHSVFDNFSKLYFELYREKYSRDFKSLMNETDETK